MKHKIVLVDLTVPCTACLITDNLLKEVLEKVRRIRGDVETEMIRIERMSELRSIPGVEVEKLPLILIDGEQVTAGGFITPKQLIAMLRDG